RNYTRFAVIAKEFKDIEKADKTSLVFLTGHKPGSLFEVLKIFSEHKINLVKLESRPMPGKPWEYMFYADIEADLETESLVPVMDKLKEKTETLKIIGRY
ncbi:MAG: ACT domain-containing protein, partial [Thermodesulfobacteriota bacterium]